MKKLLSLLVVLILISSSNLYARLKGDAYNVYSNTLINGKGNISYSFDVVIPPDFFGIGSANEGDFIEIDLGANNLTFSNTNFQVLQGKKVGNLVYYIKLKNKLDDIKLRIEGKISGVNIKNLPREIKIGNYNGKEGWLHNVFIDVPDTLFRNPSALQIKVKSDMDLGSTIPGGTLSTNGKGTVRKGHPAEIYIESSSIQNNDKKVKVSIEKDVVLTRNEGNEIINAAVSIRKNGNNLTKELELEEQNGKYKTEVVEIDGLSEKIDSKRHPKGIYEGQIKVRVTYGE